MKPNQTSPHYFLSATGYKLPYIFNLYGGKKVSCDVVVFVGETDICLSCSNILLRGHYSKGCFPLTRFSYVCVLYTHGKVEIVTKFTH